MDENVERLKELLEARINPSEAIFGRVEKAEKKVSSDISSAAKEVKTAVEEATTSILDEVKKKPTDVEFTYELTPEETESLRGEKGEDGEPGADADEEEIIDRVIPEVLKAVPTPEEVAALVEVPEPIKGDPGEKGKDGTEIEPDQVVDKVNLSKKKIKKEVLELPEPFDSENLDRAIGILDKRTEFLINKKVVKTVNGSAPDAEGNVTVTTADVAVKVSANDTTGGYLNGKLVAGANITLTENNDGGNETLTVAATGGDTSGLVPYTGATGNLDLGAFNYVTANAATPNDIGITSGNATSGNNTGGAVIVDSGSGFGTGAGGGVAFTAGTGGATGDGGAFDFTAGVGGATSGHGGVFNLIAGDTQGGNSNGGAFNLTAGAGTGTGNGGNFTFNAGVKGSGGVDGTYKFYSPTAAVYANLDTSSIATTDKTYTFQNLTGIIALQSSALTEGSVPFAGSTGLLAQDNANFFWDDTLNQLVVGKTLGSNSFANPTPSSTASWIGVSGAWSYASSKFTHGSNGSAAVSQSNVWTIGRAYEVTWTILDWTVGTITFSGAGFTGTARTGNGTYTERFVATSTTGDATFTPSNTARLAINTFVRAQVDAGAILSANYVSFRQGNFNQANSNSNITTGTPVLRLNNSGTFTTMQFSLSGTLKAGAVINSSGAINWHATGGDYFALYSGVAASPTNYLIAPPTHLGHSGRIGAGSTGTPSSTLTTAKSFGRSNTLITTNTTLDDTHGNVFLNSSAAAVDVTFPAITASLLREYKAKTIDATNTIRMLPAGTDTVENAASYDMSVLNQAGTFTPRATLSNCSDFSNTDEGTCTANDGCSWEDPDCNGTYVSAGNWNVMDTTPVGAALTKTDDTNVTLTLGGTPTTALLTASSLTLGWTGTLAVARGGTGADNTTQTYTPTLTNTTNVAASTARLCTYFRVGNVVTVAGQLDIDPTTTLTATLLGISLPIASNFTTAYQLGGTASATAIAGETAGIEADPTNDRASLKYVAADITNHTQTFTFSYQVL